MMTTIRRACRIFLLRSLALNLSPNYVDYVSSPHCVENITNRYVIAFLELLN